MDENEQYLTKTVDLIREHAPPGFAKQWYSVIQRAISQNTVTEPFGCLTVADGKLSVATLNVPASNRSAAGF